MAIKTSKPNQAVIERLRQLYDFKYKYVPARIAIAYSLQKNKTFVLDDIMQADSSGQEFDENDLFGGRDNFTLYKALFCQHYGRILDDNEFLRLVKLHLDYGLEQIANEVLRTDKGRNAHIDYLMSIVRRGLNLISIDRLISNPEPDLVISNEFSDLVDFTLGKTDNGDTINIRLNDLNEFMSHHIAIAGMNGSGKTELIKDVLFQISKKTNNNLKFIFFDYKGEGKSDKLKSFLDVTNCEYVNPLDSPFIFNPLSFINLTNERYQNFNINSFVDAVAAIETKLGAKQKNVLKTVLSSCFENRRDGKHPDLKEVFEQLSEYYASNELKPDSLFAILKDLASGLFSSPSTQEKIYTRSIYLSLPEALSETLRQLCVFLTLKYLLSEFTNKNDVVPNEKRYNPLRYIIVLDEAHVYLNNKNARRILEQVLRVIRSKGVVIIMISQGTEDYIKPDFDFASQIKIPICLDVKNKSHKIIERFIGTAKSEVKLKKAVEGLVSGKGIVNFDEPRLFSLNQFWRTIKGEEI